MKLALSIFIISLGYIISGCNGFLCEEENFLGLTKYKQCPGDNDPPEYQYCCGTKERRFCCQNILNLDEDDIKEIAKSLPAIIGTIIAIAFGLIVLCIVCCCCCPFCLLHKRRTRGTVHNPVPAQAQLQPMMNPPAQYGPPQPAPYPQAPYPTPAYQQPPPAGYAPSPAPYPTQPMPEQPPPYVEKQMPYNPNY